MSSSRLIRRFRVVPGLFIFCLVASGLTAFPLEWELDWLAFSHLVIAVFFLGPLRQPTRHDWVLISGMIACAGVIPLALVCGTLRGIPFYWQCIDCSFGVFGIMPLAYCLAVSRRLKRMGAGGATSIEIGGSPQKPATR